MAKLPGLNLEFTREDDYVEYFVFPDVPEALQTAQQNAEQLAELRDQLEKVLEQINTLVARHVEQRNYIWHKDAFRLQLRTGSAKERLLNDELKADDEGTLPPHLHGVTHYGDNISDEWFIVYLLYEITREISGCIVRVIDSDGEFLLIEAADELPKWANPETCEQRVYISDGALQLVQNSPSNTTKLIPVATAVTKMRLNPALYKASKEIQATIAQRLEEFSGPNTNLHRQVVRVPLGVAALLKREPTLIAAAVRAFCERDSADLKAIRSMRYFPPEQRVCANVCFTRCLYAMLMHNNYVPDKKTGWNLSRPSNTEKHKEDLLGVKLACGFEILACRAKDSGSEENDPAWRTYMRSLVVKGYFDGNIEGSKEYARLQQEARDYFKKNNERFSTFSLVGERMLELLRSTEVNAQQLRDEENNLQPSDSDDWLNISSEQLDAMLMERFGPKKLYKLDGDVNAEEFTKNIADFLEKQSAFDGVDSDDDEDITQVTASPTKRSEEFKAKVKKNNSMRKACNRNSIINPKEGGEPEDSGSTHVQNFLDFVIPEDNWDSNSEMSDYEDEADLERNFEAMTNTEMNVDFDIKTYMAQMDKELAQTTVGKSFEAGDKSDTKNSKNKSSGEDDFDDIESFEPININVNALKNMMDSYKSQLGGAGPVSSLLNAMGAGMSAAANVNEAVKDLSESTV